MAFDKAGQSSASADVVGSPYSGGGDDDNFYFNDAAYVVANGWGGNDNFYINGAVVLESSATAEAAYTIDGGTGYDTVNISGSSANFSVARDEFGRWNIYRGSILFCQLSGVEKLVFDDRTIGLDSPTDSVLGDGFREIVVQNTQDQAVAYFDGGLQWTGAGTMSSAWTLIGEFDLDGDGKASMVFRNSDGALGKLSWNFVPQQVPLNNSAPSLWDWSGAGFVGNSWSFVGGGDFNSDGKADLVFASIGSGGVPAGLLGFLSYGTGGSTTWTMIGSVAANWSAVGVGRFDSGTATGVLLYDAVNRSLGYVGTDQVVQLAVPKISKGWSVAGVGDFNGDGVDDVLMYNADLKAVGYFAFDQHGKGTWSGFANGFVGDWSVAGVGNYGGDVRSDILLRDAQSGGIGILLADTGNTLSWYGVGLVSSSWHVA